VSEEETQRIKKELENLGVNVSELTQCKVGDEATYTCLDADGNIFSYNKEALEKLKKYDLGEPKDLIDLPEDVASSLQESLDYEESSLVRYDGTLVPEEELKEELEWVEAFESEFGLAYSPEGMRGEYLAEIEENKKAYYVHLGDQGMDISELVPKEEMKGKYVIEWTPAFSNIVGMKDLDKYFKIDKIVNTKKEALDYIRSRSPRPRQVSKDLFYENLTWFRITKKE
jgi:hypothetical protein